MALPTGWKIDVTAVHGSPAVQARISYTITNSSGVQVGADSYTIPHTPPSKTDSFTGDGTTAAFTTSTAVYDNLTVAVGGSVVTDYTTATDASGETVITLTTAPAAKAAIKATYDTGPGLTNKAGDIPTTLGLSKGTGTVYTGTVGGSSVSVSTATADALGTALYAWATARVEADIF